MNFIEGMPILKVKNIIIVIANRLTKYAHFIAISHPCTALDIAQMFMDQFYILHRQPTIIVTDEDKIFTSLKSYSSCWGQITYELCVSLSN